MLLPALVAAFAAHAPVAVTGDHWIADFDQAAALAKKEGKDLLVDFTGSDWCGPCIRLHQEVFDTDAFLVGTRDHFILVSLDFPQGDAAKQKVPNPQRNQELARTYGVDRYPTILLTTPDGDVYGKAGYRAGGPEKYVEHLTSLRTSGKARLAELDLLAAKCAAARGTEQDQHLDGLIQLLADEPDGSPFLGKLAALVRFAFTSDPDNQKGLKLKAVTTLVNKGALDDATIAAAKALDGKNEKGLLERVVLAQCSAVNSEEAIAPAVQAIDDLVAAGTVKDKKVATQLFANGMFWSRQFLNDLAKAKVYARKLKDLAVEDPHLQKMVEEILAS